MPRPKTDNVRINIFMEPKILRAMKMLAARRGTTYSQLMRDACREFAVRELTAEKAK